MHLTLRFLGEVGAERITFVEELLSKEAGSRPAFEVIIEGFGCFPSKGRPRVLWLGVRAGQVLYDLQRHLEVALSDAGFPADEQPFSAHLTLGRVRRNPSTEEMRKLRAIVHETEIGLVGAATICRIHLFRSDLQETGPIYTSIFSAPLTGHAVPIEVTPEPH
jgi:2'-5' RNA ligase